MGDAGLYVLLACTLVVAGVVVIASRYSFGNSKSVDYDDWRELAVRRDWSFTSSSHAARIVARLHGAQVIASAAITTGARTPTPGVESVDDDDTVVVATSIMAPIIGAPPGFSIHERSQADKTAGRLTGTDITLRDRELAAAIVATGDPDTVEALLARPNVRQMILELVPHGRFSIALDVILLFHSGPPMDADLLEVLVERVARLAEAIGVPGPGDRATPVPAGPGIRRPRLGALVQRVAGTATTTLGGSPADELRGRAIICQLQLDMVQLRNSPTDTPHELLLIGTDVHGPTKVEVKTKATGAEVRKMLPGTIITVEAIVDRYDQSRDRAELQADGPLLIQENPEPTTKHQREVAFAAMADQVSEKDDLAGLVEVLHGGSSTRARLLVEIAGREYQGEFVPTQVDPSRDSVVPVVARGGTTVVGRIGKRDVEVVVPADKPAPNGTIRASVLRWDEFLHRPVLLMTGK